MPPSGFFESLTPTFRSELVATSTQLSAPPLRVDLRQGPNVSLSMVRIPPDLLGHCGQEVETVIGRHGRIPEPVVQVKVSDDIDLFGEHEVIGHRVNGDN